MTAALEVKEEAREKSRAEKKAQAKAKQDAVRLALGPKFLAWAATGEYNDGAFRGCTISTDHSTGTYKVGVKVWGDTGEALIAFGEASNLTDAILLIPALVRTGRFMPDKYASPQRGAAKVEFTTPLEDDL